LGAAKAEELVFLEATPTPKSPVKTATTQQIGNWHEIRSHQQLNLPPQPTTTAPSRRRKRQKEYECECKRKYYEDKLKGRIRHSDECHIQTHIQKLLKTT
jgi:hypothetical protein